MFLCRAGCTGLDKAAHVDKFVAMVMAAATEYARVQMGKKKKKSGEAEIICPPESVVKLESELLYAVEIQRTATEFAALADALQGPPSRNTY